MDKPLKALLILLCLGTSLTTLAAGVQVNSARVTAEEKGFKLELASTFSLDKDVTEALDNGISLTFEIETTLQRQRSFWFDAQVTTSVHRFSLSRHALSERYTLQQHDGSQARTFKTIEEALAALGAWEERLSCEPCREHPRSRYVGRTRVRLLTDQLPAPMRPLIWISPAWWVSSGWQRWEVSP